MTKTISDLCKEAVELRDKATQGEWNKEQQRYLNLKQAQVFTPRWAADQMLDLLDQEQFCAEDTFFFEPTCGNGEILIPMLDRIYGALLKKYGCPLKTLAETIHKFYAIELDKELVKECRINVWSWVTDKAGENPDYKLLCDYLVANQIIDTIEHNDFFVVMREASDGAIARKSKRKSLQELSNKKTSQ